MGYQTQKINKATARVWERNYETWSPAPAESHRDEWISSIQKRLLYSIRDMACRMSASSNKQPPQWIKDMFDLATSVADGAADDESAAASASGHCALAKVPAEMDPPCCPNCGTGLTDKTDPNNRGQCDLCDQKVDSPKIEFILGYSYEFHKAYKTKVDKKGKAGLTTYTTVFCVANAEDHDFVQAKFPDCEPVPISDLTVAEFKEIHKVDKLLAKGSVFTRDIDGETIKLVRSQNKLGILQRHV